MRRAAVLLLFLATRLAAQEWPDRVGFEVQSAVNVTYAVASGQELKLDVHSPRAAGPHPVVVYIHGGGWIAGTKEDSVLRLLPFLAQGAAVVNVEYRLARVALAPAAVEDCRCALRWVIRNAERYRLDPKRIVLAGSSAGGHLALMTGMLRRGDGFDRACPSDEKIRWTDADRSEPKVAGIVSIFGISDVADLIGDSPNARAYAIEWIGNRDDAAALARRISPLTYVRRELPPILTIHGDADTVVPLSHATRLHDALTKAGAPNELVIVKGAGHGTFAGEQITILHDAVRRFLDKQLFGR
ncbi:MAG TPA: alpha/beta hydrolase [Thermoanaerobaculia bacterium]|jgi:acetyl esterase/lipase